MIAQWLTKRIDKWIEQRAALIGSFPAASGDPVLLEMFGGQPTRSGQQVTEQTALCVSAVFACVRLITETIAGLPKHVYEREPGSRRTKIATDHPVQELLRNPNPNMTDFDVFEALQPSLELGGDCYGQVVWNKRGDPVEIWPWDPRNVKVEENGKDIRYEFATSDGPKQIPPHEVLHVRQFGNGLKGRSTLRYARESIGLAISAEEYGARYFGQGFHARGVFKVPGGLQPEQEDELRKTLDRFHGGVERAHKTLIAKNNAEYTSIGIAPDDMQFLQTRKFQVIDIARIFRCPPHLIGDLDNAKWANVEQQAIDFVMYSIQPRAIRWEKTLTRTLIPQRDRGRYFIKLNLDGLLRADSKTRNEAHAVAVVNGWKTRNEVRDDENLNPIDGLDEPLMPLNMVPISAAGQTPDGESDTNEAATGEAQVEPDTSQRSESRTGGLRAEQRAISESIAKIRDRHRPLFRAAAERLTRKEVAQVRAAFNRIVGVLGDVPTERSAESFSLWLHEFYGDFPEEVQEAMGPAVRVLMDAIGEATAGGLGKNEAEMEAYAQSYLIAMGQRWANASNNQLQGLLSDVSQVGERLDEWLEKKPERVEQNETEQASNAAAREAMRQGGVTKLRWVASGQSCPICMELDGVIVSIDEPFVRAGDLINPNKENQDRESDQKISLRIDNNKFHPPLHGGCDCTIVPG